MIKYLSYGLLLLSLVACATFDKEKSVLFDQVHYEEQLSKRKVKLDDYSDSPRKSVKTVTVMRDAGIGIIYSSVSTKKSDAHGPYWLQINDSDTVELDQLEHPFVKSEYILSGTFVRPKTTFPVIESTKRMVFSTDGTCIESSVTNCSDSPCSTLHQRLGDYRMINDTLHVAFYRSRALFSGFRDKVKLEDVQWHVSEPEAFQFMLTDKSDSLLRYNAYQDKMHLLLVSEDTIQVIQNGEE